MRTAFCTIVRESQDLACGVFDTRGNMVAQSETGTPGHINAMATVHAPLPGGLPARDARARRRADHQRSVDDGRPDQRHHLVTPIFRDGRVVAFFANTCHVPDIGGRILSAEAREVYEEGLLIPIMKLFMRGRAQRGAVPDHSRQRAHAATRSRATCTRMASCNDVGGAQLLEFMRRVRAATASTRSPRRSSSAPSGRMRAAIARAARRRVRERGVVDGFEEPVAAQGDGDRRRRRADRRPHRHLAAEPLRHQRGHELHPRLHQLRGEVRRSAPEVPHNEGAFRPVTSRRRRAAILNCAAPGAGGRAAPDRPLPAGPDLRRAGAGDARTG